MICLSVPCGVVLCWAACDLGFDSFLACSQTPEPMDFVFLLIMALIRQLPGYN